MPETPEQKARAEIDTDLTAAGWIVQSRDETDLTAARGVAIREFPMRPGFGFADYLLYVDRKVIGAVEAKAEGTLTGVEAQSAKYAAGLPENLPAHRLPLPFLFESNATVTYFTNGLDPVPRSRQVFNFPRPETLADLAAQHRFELTRDELERLRLRYGDLLIVEGNGSRSEIGRCAMWRGEVNDCVHQNHIIRVRPLKRPTRKVTSSASKAQSHEEIGRYWDTHRLVSSGAGGKAVDFSVTIRRRQFTRIGTPRSAPKGQQYGSPGRRPG